MAKLRLLNLDASYPVSDAHHLNNGSGVVRFTDQNDELSLGMFQRFQGDLIHRSKLIEGSVNDLIDFINKSPVLAGFDETPFIRVDGSRSLSKPLSCEEGPTTASHLTRKDYVDAAVSAANSSVTQVANDLADFETSQAKAHKSPWTLYTWQAGKNTIVDLPISGLFNPDNVESISILERLDISVPTQATPNPQPIYVYRDLSRGTKGMAVDDFWYSNEKHSVRVLIPNLVSYESYSGSGNEALQTPRTRWLKAVIKAP